MDAGDLAIIVVFFLFFLIEFGLLIVGWMRHSRFVMLASTFILLSFLSVVHALLIYSYSFVLIFIAGLLFSLASSIYAFRKSPDGLSFSTTMLKIFYLLVVVLMGVTF